MSCLHPYDVLPNNLLISSKISSIYEELQGEILYSNKEKKLITLKKSH